VVLHFETNRDVNTFAVAAQLTFSRIIQDAVLEAVRQASSLLGQPGFAARQTILFLLVQVLPSTLHTSLFHFPDAEIRCAYLVIAPERLRVALRNQPPRFKHVATIADRECQVGILLH
jgi:hypothetical protein